LNVLKAYGLVTNATLFPHGVAARAGRLPSVRPLGPGAAPVIGCYGFFLPRKGVDQVIRAFAVLRRRWPKAKLRLVNAEFPDSASKNEIALCQVLARRLGVFDAIEWRTEFLENEESQRLLGECDLVVLAHQETKESASGAVRMAITSGAPVAVTPISIFEDVRPAVAELGGLDAEAIAEGLTALLADRAARQRLQARAAEWAQAYAWPVLAERLARMAAGLVAAARVPGGSERLPDLAPEPVGAPKTAQAAETRAAPAAALLEMEHVAEEALRA
jgi:glycosyltransferase involved in cell wall biosynthesis